MKRVRATAEGAIEIQQVEQPAPSAGQVRLTPVLTGICGSDTHALAGQHAMLTLPYFPGHEAIAVVDELGEGVAGLDVGQRVVIKPNVPCGTCINCRADRSNACQTLQWIGCDPSDTHPGAMAERVVTPAENLYPIPDSVSDEEGVLIECLATPVHAARIAGENLDGGAVLVIGAGTIGLLTVLAARAGGAKTIVVSDLDAGKRERATANEADAAVDAASDSFADDVLQAAGGRIDVVFDCVANARSAVQAVNVLRRAGSLVLVGVPAGDYQLPMGPIQDWELRVQGSASYNETDFAKAVEMAVDGKIPASEIITARFDLDEAGQAFEQAANNSSGKVVVRS